MILHLERKFTAPTEVFIADQINFQNEYKNIVFTAKHLNYLKITINPNEYDQENFNPQQRVNVYAWNAKCGSTALLV